MVEFGREVSFVSPPFFGPLHIELHEGDGMSDCIVFLKRGMVSRPYFGKVILD